MERMRAALFLLRISGSKANSGEESSQSGTTIHLYTLVATSVKQDWNPSHQKPSVVLQKSVIWKRKLLQNNKTRFINERADGLSRVLMIFTTRRNSNCFFNGEKTFGKEKMALKTYECATKKKEDKKCIGAKASQKEWKMQDWRGFFRKLLPKLFCGEK